MSMATLKMNYAADARAMEQLALETNAEAKDAHVSGLQLIRVPRSTKTETSLHAAREDLLALKAGETDLPRC